ncbi:MAG: hypothetical protein Q4G33_05405, partial [bacterium]|nr:hypothetical protein [bacterium]
YPTDHPTDYPTDQPDNTPYIVELTVENGQIAAVIQGKTAEDTSVQGFIAQYDAQGRLVGICVQSWEGGNSSFTADAVPGAVSARGFVWNVNYEPLAAAKNAYIAQ